MPATEETYYKTPTMHVVFAVSSIAMLLSIVWMIAADHFRPWKDVQRRFYKIEDAKLRQAEADRQRELEQKYRDQLEGVERRIAAAREQERANAREIRQVRYEIKTADGELERLDTAKRFKKAELDSQRSFYDGMIDRGEEAEARTYLATTIRDSEAELEKITRTFEAAEARKVQAAARLADLRGHVEDLEKEKEGITREADRARRVRQQKQAQYGEGSVVNRVFAFLRDIPGIDMAASPTKIQQISLPELTINYNFKDVPRYDRCTTCHLGIDRLGYEKTADGKPMPEVYASHPHLTDGATAVDPKGNVVQAGLYLDANGPHPINNFGCTICHGGQGSGTSFTYASHEPTDLHEAEEWGDRLGWHRIHFWDEPMRPSRFLESSCLKCHHEVTDVPQARKLQAGYERIVTYGCTGCHAIGGEGVNGPDLTDSPQVGPNLAHLGAKASKDWTLKWIKNPHAFRPDTRMPRFYGVTNNDHKADWPKNHAEIHAITHYLYAKSTPPEGFVDPPVKGDAGRGKDLFLQKGCLACHAHEEYDPASFPESVRDYARADFGPNLSNVAAKFASDEEGFKWLANWIKAPERYHPKSLMPNLQLSWQDAADIAAWVLSVPGEWPRPLHDEPELDGMPAVDSEEVREGLDELVALYKGKSVPLSRLDEAVKAMTQDEKLMFVGERTIGRLGCFGCHNIPGFENYKQIGTPLNDWGFKSPTKLDFAHIAEYLADEQGDGTPEYYQEKLDEHDRMGFLFQKLHRPRSYDYKKTREELKAWDERLRMPQFTWADDPQAVEEVMTFILGLTGEKISDKYLPHYDPATLAKARGERLLNRYNCAGCHTLEMPQYTIASELKLDEAMPQFETNVTVSYGSRASDHLQLYPDLSWEEGGAEEAVRKLEPPKDVPVVIEGMPTAVFEDELTVQVWKPVTIRGHTFNVGDNLTLDRTKVRVTPPRGGNFAWLYATQQADQTGNDFGSFWNRLPPPLVREGLKVQTPWLTGFLKDPYPIRPAVNLRMPRFHYLQVGRDTKELADFFAARDGATFPYQDIPEREQEYLTEREEQHADYLTAGWQLMTKGACIQCHAIGQYKPTGGEAVVNGPDLRQVASRFRPEYLLTWLARPSRLLPFTAMPQNIPPHGPPAQFVPKSFEDQPFDQVRAIRDTLLNYVNAVEQQLASGGAGEKKADEAKASGGGE